MTVGLTFGEHCAVGSTYARWHPDFRFGAATSAYQTEGGLHANNWAEWEKGVRPDGRPAIANGDRCGRAVDSWERFEEDLACLVWLGVDSYRFSVEWSRVEPLRGYVDEEAVARYRDWCVQLRGHGITPLVTLHHFTEPSWFSDAGGFTKSEGPGAWVRFVDLMANRLGDVVDDWITINEPVGYVVQGWIRGLWPPGRTDPAVAARVLENLLLAHAQAYRALHDIADRRSPAAAAKCRVGMAHHIVVFRPRRPGSPLDRWAARVIDDSYNHAVPRALQNGHFRLRLPGLRHRAHHPGLIGTQDFLGLNHYQPLYASVRFPRGGALPILQVEASRSGVKDDLGYDLDPRSLAEAVTMLSRYDLPIHITENGTCDGGDPDLRRSAQLTASLQAVSDLGAQGVDIRSYFHWTLTDNFEWAFGWNAHFGLFRVDRESYKRTPTASAFVYRDLIRAHRDPPKLHPDEVSGA